MNGQLFIFSACAISYFICQLIKFLDIKEKKDKTFQTFFFKKGGIISAHSATMISLIVSLYLVEGVSNLLIVSIIFALLIYTEIWKDTISKTGRHTFRELILGCVVGELVALTLFVYMLL